MSLCGSVPAVTPRVFRLPPGCRGPFTCRPPRPLRLSLPSVSPHIPPKLLSATSTPPKQPFPRSALTSSLSGPPFYSHPSQAIGYIQQNLSFSSPESGIALRFPSSSLNALQLYFVIAFSSPLLHLTLKPQGAPLKFILFLFLYYISSLILEDVIQKISLSTLIFLILEFMSVCACIPVHVTAVTALFHFHTDKWDVPLLPCIQSSLCFTLPILGRGFKNSELISSPHFPLLVFQQDSWVRSLSSLLMFPTKNFWVSQCSNLVLKLPWCSFTLHLNLGCCCKISVIAHFHFVHPLHFLLLFISYSL